MIWAKCRFLADLTSLYNKVWGSVATVRRAPFSRRVPLRSRLFLFEREVAKILVSPPLSHAADGLAPRSHWDALHSPASGCAYAPDAGPSSPSVRVNGHAIPKRPQTIHCETCGGPDATLSISEQGHVHWNCSQHGPNRPDFRAVAARVRLEHAEGAGLLDAYDRGDAALVDGKLRRV